MATNYPTSLDSLTNPTSTDGLDSPDHAAQHANANDAIEALQEKVGIDDSVDTSSIDYKIASGWITAGETWTFSSVDDPTGIITVPSDATTKYSVGMRISFVNATNTIYGIITAVTSTTITFLHEIDSTDSEALHLMVDSAITVPFYSTQKAPLGFPLDPTKWTVEAKLTTSSTITTPTQNQWYNAGSIGLSVPIGGWNLQWSAIVGSQKASAHSFYATLSTGNTTESDSDFTIGRSLDSGTWILDSYKEKKVTMSSKTSYYLNISTKSASVDNIYNNGAIQNTIIRAVSAYL